MAKHFMYWVIVAGAQPTAFRSRYAEDLLPTLKQLQRTQPDAALKWFERDRFWDSPEAARASVTARRASSRGRGTGWRPGGRHEDPRAKYDITRDEKRARFKRRMIGGKTKAAGPTGRAPSKPKGPK
jgi:hypothetical protein